MATTTLGRFTTYPLSAPLNGTDLNANLQAVENALSDLGPFILTGLVPSAGTGLAVNVTAGIASNGGRLTVAAGFTISGLTDTTTNHLYLTAAGTGTSNTSGTAPANSIKLGTAVTAAGVVSSVQTTRAAGRQVLVRHENLVPGSGAGHPRAVNLASWHASNQEGNEVFGLLPAGAFGAGALNDLSDVNIPTVAQGDILYRNATEWVRLVAGTSGQFLTTAGAAANPSWTSLPGNVFLKDADQTLSDGTDIAVGSTTGSMIGTANTQKLGKWGSTPIIQPAAFTQTYATATRTLGAYTSDGEGSSYSGIDNLQIGTPYATVADLNQLRTAYETLRVFAENVGQVLNALIDDHQSSGDCAP